MNKRIIEVCCGSTADVIAAREGGAARIELCSALELGGLTPTCGQVLEAAREMPSDMRFHVLIRLRGGDFVYSRSEIEAMRFDICQLSRSPVDGFAIGALTPDGQIDTEACSHLMSAAPHKSFTLHRAFDLCRDPFQAMETAISLGFQRILTSGCQPSALDGIETIEKLVEKAHGRIIIMPAAGINPDNIQMIESRSGATEFHSTCRGEARIRQVFGRPALGFGENTPQRHTNQSVVAALVNRK